MREVILILALQQRKNRNFKNPLTRRKFCAIKKVTRWGVITLQRVAKPPKVHLRDEDWRVSK